MNGLRSQLVRTLTALLLVSTTPAFAADASEPPTLAPAAAEARAHQLAAPEAAAPEAAAPEAAAPEAANATPSGARAPEVPDLNAEPLAADPLTPEALAGVEGAPEEETLLWTLIRTFLVLAFVIVCIYLVLNFGLRRMMGLKATGAGGANALVTVVERIPLGPKQTLLVLKAAGEYLLVGSGDAGMNLIAKLQTEEVERLQSERAIASGSMSPFLQKLLSRGGHPPPSA